MILSDWGSVKVAEWPGEWCTAHFIREGYPFTKPIKHSVISRVPVQYFVCQTILKVLRIINCKTFAFRNFLYSQITLSISKQLLVLLFHGLIKVGSLSHVEFRSSSYCSSFWARYSWKCDQSSPKSRLWWLQQPVHQRKKYCTGRGVNLRNRAGSLAAFKCHLLWKNIVYRKMTAC